MLTFGISCGGHDPFRSFSLYVILIETMEIGDPFCNLCTIFNQLPLFLLAQWSLKRHVPKQFGGPRQMRLWLSDKSIIYLSSFRIQSPPNHEEHSSVFVFFFSDDQGIQAILRAPRLIIFPVQSKTCHPRRDQEIYKKLFSYGLIPRIEPWLIVYRTNQPTNRTTLGAPRTIHRSLKTAWAPLPILRRASGNDFLVHNIMKISLFFVEGHR